MNGVAQIKPKKPAEVFDLYIEQVSLSYGRKYYVISGLRTGEWCLNDHIVILNNAWRAWVHINGRFYQITDQKQLINWKFIDNSTEYPVSESEIAWIKLQAVVI